MEAAAQKSIWPDTLRERFRQKVSKKYQKRIKKYQKSIRSAAGVSKKYRGSIRLQKKCPAGHSVQAYVLKSVGPRTLARNSAKKVSKKYKKSIQWVKECQKSIKIVSKKYQKSIRWVAGVSKKYREGYLLGGWVGWLVGNPWTPDLGGWVVGNPSHWFGKYCLDCGVPPCSTGLAILGVWWWGGSSGIRVDMLFQ